MTTKVWIMSAAAALVVAGTGAAVVVHSNQAEAVSATSVAEKALQLDEQAASAQDPSLPAVVASVAGVQISGPELAAMEGSLANRNLGTVGSDATRQLALRTIISHIMIAQAAAKAGFTVNATFAQQQATNEGMPATAQVIADYEYGQLQADLMQKVMAGQTGQAGATTWDAYVNQLVASAPVNSHVPWWSN